MVMASIITIIHMRRISYRYILAYVRFGAVIKHRYLNNNE